MFKLTFLREKYHQLSTKELDKLSPTAFYFFRFLIEFVKSRDIKNEVNVYAVDNSLQCLHTDYCRPFQLHFSLNLFEPSEGSTC